MPWCALFGVYPACQKVTTLRRLIAPTGAREEGWCEVCVKSDVFLLQMRNEVQLRAAAGEPIVPPRDMTMQR